MRFSVFNIVDEIMGGATESELISLDPCSFVILLGPISNRDAYESKLNYWANTLSNMLKMYLNLDISIVIGTPYNDIQSLRVEFERCQKAMELKARRYRKEVNQVIEYVKLNICEKITLGMLAKEVRMNESYLSRIFKQETGTSLFQYMNELKIKKAMELLRQPYVMVKEVAAAVGIEDPFYFNRLFNKICGLSPTDYKKKLFFKEM